MCHRSCIWFVVAWVLWVQYELIGVGDTRYERSWVPEAAYPTDGYATCIQDMRTLAERYVKDARSAPNVASIERVTLIGDRVAVTTDYKSGGSSRRLYVCFPDSVQPD